MCNGEYSGLQLAFAGHRPSMHVLAMNRGWAKECFCNSTQTRLEESRVPYTWTGCGWDEDGNAFQGAVVRGYG